MDARTAEVLELSERDYARVVALLENPPPPNDKLLAAIAALPDVQKRRWLGVTLPSRKQSRVRLFQV